MLTHEGGEHAPAVVHASYAAGETGATSIQNEGTTIVPTLPAFGCGAGAGAGAGPGFDSSPSPLSLPLPLLSCVSSWVSVVAGTRTMFWVTLTVVSVVVAVSLACSNVGSEMQPAIERALAMKKKEPKLPTRTP